MTEKQQKRIDLFKKDLISLLDKHNVVIELELAHIDYDYSKARLSFDLLGNDYESNSYENELIETDYLKYLDKDTILT